MARLGIRPLLSCCLLMAPVLLARDAGTVDPRNVLLKTDAEFASATAQRGLDGFLPFLSENVTKVMHNGREVKGKREVARTLKKLFDSPGVRFKWTPMKAEVSSDVLGYTYGVWEGPGGWRGEYLTVWKKQKDGSWKVLADIGS